MRCQCIFNFVFLYFSTISLRWHQSNASLHRSTTSKIINIRWIELESHDFVHPYKTPISGDSDGDSGEIVNSCWHGIKPLFYHEGKHFCTTWHRFVCSLHKISFYTFRCWVVVNCNVQFIAHSPFFPKCILKMVVWQFVTYKSQYSTKMSLLRGDQHKSYRLVWNATPNAHRFTGFNFITANIFSIDHLII